MIKVEVKGLRELQAKLSKKQSSLTTEGEAVLERAAQVFVRNAKRDAPKDMGRLAQGISYMKTGALSFTIVSAQEYSPYVEWGTITKVKVPAGEQNYAIQFKGRGIKKNGGVHPRPFFFRQTPFAKAEAEKGLKALVGTL
jgi:HK97 gp10 family phage protein